MTILASLLIIIAAFSITLLVLVGHILTKQHLPAFQADVALVFGTGLGWKAKARWTHAAQLYNQRLVRYIIVSGGIPVPQQSQTEAEWFRDNLLLLGVLKEHILIENQAANAFENATFALPIIQQHNFKTVILVMSDFTGLRAHLTAKRAWAGSGIKIFNSHAPSGSHWNQWTWWLSREGWGLTLYVVKRLFKYRLLRFWRLAE